MMPRLQAEESMLVAERLAVGTGAAQADSRREILDGWRSAAGSPPRSKRTRLAPAALGEAGIGYHVVETDAHD
jgi:hypothetical protein